MLNKFQTIYTNTTVDPYKDEDGKVSYWLEKLHDQGEKQVKVENKKDLHFFQQAGIDQQTKNQATKEEVDKQTVNDLVKKSNRYIISISSAFPWTISPNTINVEEGRVTLIFRQFMSSQSRSVDIKDISNVFIESSLLFATIQIVSRTFTQNDIKIGYLNKKKAYKIRRIIEGLRIFANNNIDTSHYEIRELIAKTEEFHTNNSNESQLM